MAAIIIALGALAFEKVQDKRRASRARKAEYERDFEALKAENAKRVERLRGGRDCDADRTVYTSDSESDKDEPPNYDAIIAPDKSSSPRHRRRSLLIRSKVLLPSRS
ncbi:MAG: hypothetical protein M1838_001288 [Thelocarpon superellum]|nr:MAG: hypothetical protein M1838_001288 [Thelocarpon superellum]